MSGLNLVIGGAIAMAALLLGVFFLRFWHQTRDTFFLYFAACFWLEAASRVVAVAFQYTSEDEPLLYLVRLISYGLIIVAIWQKNRPPSNPPGG